MREFGSLRLLLIKVQDSSQESADVLFSIRRSAEVTEDDTFDQLFVQFGVERGIDGLQLLTHDLDLFFPDRDWDKRTGQQFMGEGGEVRDGRTCTGVAGNERMSVALSTGDHKSAQYLM